MNGRLSRRVFLKILIAFLAAGCAPNPDAPGAMSGKPKPLQIIPAPTPTQTPLPTPTPLPSADGAATAFLSAWSAGDFEAMYNLLTWEDRQALNMDDFRARYQDAQTEATVVALQNDIRTLLHSGSQATATFLSRWQTAMFGPLEFKNTLPLRWEEGRWAVDWSSSLVMPQLGEGLGLVLLDQTAVRGNIYDRNGLGLAVEGQRVTIGVVPGWIEDETSVIYNLSAITGVPLEDIQAKIANSRPEWFVPIADVSPEVSVSNDELLSSLRGVMRRENVVREYKTGRLAAHLIGYLGSIPSYELTEWQARGYRGDELVGRSGVEGWGEEYLSSKRGGRLVVLNQQNHEIAQVAEVPPRPGDSIYMTIDKGLQADAENILGQRTGAIVVMDPNTGNILAMASYPSFDPNLFATGIDQANWASLSSDPANPLVGRGTQGSYPPGSVFKIVTIMAALEKLGLTQEQTYNCTGTWNGLGDEFIKRCWLETGHGTINLKDGLTQSCDVVFYNVGLALQNLDPQILPDTARACGLGQPTGVLGVDETAGLVPDRDWKLTQLGESWFPGDSVNMAIGQSYLLSTPLQIANLLAAVANGGTLYRPQLVQRIAERSGTERVIQPEVIGQLPVSPGNLAIIRSALEGVVSGPRGTARDVFAGATFTAAGKTGSSETGQEQSHAWFAGYMPVEAPEIVVAVILEHAGEGSEEAAPVFRQMVEAYLSRKGVPVQPTVVPAPSE